METKNTLPQVSLRDRETYGISLEAIHEDYINSITAKCVGLEMVLAGLFSDMQEEMKVGSLDQARKCANIGKYILSYMMKAKRGQA